MTLWVILAKEPVCRGGKWHGARGKEQGACEDPPDGGDESREAGEHSAQCTGHSAQGKDNLPAEVR
jgi:hypothetical protein